jgi:hypothetical protein
MAGRTTVDRRPQCRSRCCRSLGWGLLGAADVDGATLAGLAAGLISQCARLRFVYRLTAPAWLGAPGHLNRVLQAHFPKWRSPRRDPQCPLNADSRRSMHKYDGLQRAHTGHWRTAWGTDQIDPLRTFIKLWPTAFRCEVAWRNQLIKIP